MTVTDTVVQQFDATRATDFSRLDFLKTLNLEPQFMKACEQMFLDCHAWVDEVVHIQDTLTSVNEFVTQWFENLNYKRQAGNYKSFLKNAA